MTEKCEYCGKEAVYETTVNGIYVCDDNHCLLDFVMEECLEEYSPEDDEE